MTYITGRKQTQHQSSFSRRINRRFKNTAARRVTPRDRGLLLRAVCLLLIVNLLTLSVPAATAPLVKSAATGLTEDLRFGFYGGGWDRMVPKMLGFFAGGIGALPQNGTVSRVRIYPGSVTVRQNDVVVLAAVALDGQDAPLIAPVFTWTMRDEEERFPARTLPSGSFTAKLSGTFTLTAASGGQQAAVTVTVLPAAAKEENSVSGGDKTSGDEQPRSAGKSDGPLSQRPGDPHWEPGNTGSSDEPGNQPGNPSGAPLDDGAGSGNFQLSAPVVTLPGRGLDLALNLTYNSRLWNKSGNQLTYDIDGGSPAPGWSLGFGKMIFMGGNQGCMLVDADGTRHSYTGTPYSYTNSATFRGHVLDSSFIDYGCDVSYGASGRSVGWAQLANGTTINYYSTGPDNATIYPTKITDAQGNYLTITYVSGRSSAIETITDTLGRVIMFHYDANDRLTSVSAPRMTGQGAEYGTATRRTLLRLHYRQLPLSYSFPGKTVSAGDNAPWVIDSIYYPATGTGYWFGGADAAQPDYNAYYSSYGMLTKVEEQRAMSFTGDVTAPPQGIIGKGLMSKLAVYNYPLTTANEAGRTNGLNLADAPTYTRLAESWAGMDVAGEEAVTTYDVQQNAAPRVTVVTQPNGAVSRQLAHNYSSLPDSDPTKHRDGMVFQDESYVEDANGTVSIPSNPGKTYRLVGKSTVEWATGYRGIPIPANTEAFDENGHKIRSEFDYSGGMFNQVRFSCDYDNGGARLRCASTEYENGTAYTGYFDANGDFFGGRHILNLVKATGVNNPDAGVTFASRTTYEYDNYQSSPLVEALGVGQHDPTYDPYTQQRQDGACLGFDNPQCEYEGQLVPVNGYEHSCHCNGGYEQVSVYDGATEKRGNVTKTTTYADAQNQTGAIEQTNSYDITGNLVTASTSCCQLTSFQYTSATQYGYPESQTRGSADPNSPDRVTTNTEYSLATGLITQSIDANGRPSNTLFNPDSLRPTKITSATGAYSINSYDDSAMTVTEEVFEAGGTAAGRTVKTLNGVGQTRREETVGPNGISDFVDTKYTKIGQIWKESRPYRAGDTLQWTTTVYDGQGRTVEVITPDNSSSKAFYNERTAFPDSATTVSAALPPGNVIRVTDAWGRERWGRYDQQNRLVEVVEPKADGDGKVSTAGSLVTKYQYDTLGRLTQTEQVAPQTGGPVSQFRRFKYDSLGRLTRQKLAEQTATLNDNGAWVGAGGTGAAWSEAFIYDNRSNLTQKTDARGVRTNYAYYNLTTGAEDPLNRIQAVIYDTSGPRLPDSALPIHAAYNVTYEYMTTGDKSRIKKVETPGLMKEEYVYDTESRVQNYTQKINSRENRPFETSYIYDTLDRVKEIRYPEQHGMSGLTYSRRKIENSYDTVSRLTSLKVNDQQQAGNIIYNSADQVTSIKIGTAGLSQVTESYTFDPQTGRLTNQNVRRAKKGNLSETLLDLTYEYDRKYSNGTGTGATGHISKIVDNLTGAKNRQYKYDALGRLTEAKGGDTLWQQTYTYDRFGNRTNVAASGSAADGSAIPLDGIPNLAYDLTSNRITTSGFQYDAAGNQIRARAEGGTTWLKYEYDAANRLRIIKKDDGSNNGDGALLQAFLCGANNARIFADDYRNGEKTVYATLGGTTISEYVEDVANTPRWTKSYVFMGDSLLSTATPNGTSAEFTEYSHPDLLGTRMITNQQAAASYEQKTLPFGTALNAESTANTNRRFTSYDRSSATGLDYAINRTYDSKQGRFTQVDPIGMQAVSLAAPQTLNLYSYCGNDPINHTDPSGLFWGFFKKLFKWVMIAIAVIVAIALIIAAPPTVAGVLAAISAGSGATAQVLNGLGFKKAGLIFGLIAVVTGIGSLMAAQMGKGNSFYSTGDIKDKFGRFGAMSGVGSVVNSFQGTKKKKRPSVDTMINQAVLGALSRLTNSKCASYIAGNSGLDARQTLLDLQKAKQIKFKNISGLGRASVGGGSKGNIDLGYEFFRVKNPGGYVGDPRVFDADQVRQLVILHELRHDVSGIGHPLDASGSGIPNVAESNEDFNKNILDKCF